MTLRAMVERERRRLVSFELMSGALLGAAVLAVILATAAAALGGSRWMQLPRGLPLALWLLATLLLLAVAWITRRRVDGQGAMSVVARAIEREQGMRDGSLLGALEVERDGGLAARAARVARDRLPTGAPLAPSLRRSAHRRAIVAGSVALAGVLLLATTSPLFADGLRAMLRPVDAWRGALLDAPAIVDAPHAILRGSTLAVRVHAPGRSRVMLGIRQPGEPWRVDTLDVVAATGDARWSLAALRGDITLLPDDGRRAGDSVVVHAVDRAFVGGVSLRARYPAYLGRPGETLVEGETLHLPRGTIVDVSGRASVALQAIALDGSAGRATLAVNANGFRGELAAARSGELRWSATAAGGGAVDVPPPLLLDVVADSAPRIAILSPAGDTVVALQERVELMLGASDDHGIATVALRVMTGASGAAEGRLLTVAAHVGRMWNGMGAIDVASLSLAPGGAVRLRAEAVDASPWAQRGVSREVVLRRPSMDERRDAARSLGDSAVASAKTAASAQKSLAQRTDEAARAQGRQQASRDAEGKGAAKAGEKMSFENAERAKGLAAEQRAMQQRVEQLKNATRDLQQQLAAAGALDSSLARQLGEAQRLLREAMTPELQKQMQKLESAAQQMNGEQSRDALKELAQQQQRLREQLEKSAGILQRAAHEGAMQTLADQAKELAARERALGDSMARKGNERDDAAKAQRLAQQASRLRDEMSALAERLAKDHADAGAKQAAKAEAHAGASESEMRKQASSAGAQAAANEMERASESMKEARSSQVKEWKQELTAELDRAVQEMLQLSREERALEQQARSGGSKEDARGSQSAVEQGVAKTGERLQGAGKKSALLSPRSQRAVADAKDKVGEASRAMAQASSPGSQQAGTLGEAADALTRAAASLARDRERANAAGSASGFGEMMQQLQDAAKKQGQINGQAQSLMGMPGGPGGGAALPQARALARQQRSVADQLEEAGDAAGGDRAARLAREARQLADALDGGRLDAGTLARQQQLFRRLLDAGKSLEKEERDDSGKREAKSATGAETFQPGAAAGAKGAVRFQPPTWDELRALTPDERRAIQDYFARLNASQP